MVPRSHPGPPQPPPAQTSHSRREPAAFRFRFGLGGLLLVTLILCVTAAGASYFVRTLRQGPSGAFIFILFTLTAPLFLVVVVSAIHALSNRRRTRHPVHRDR